MPDKRQKQKKRGGPPRRSLLKIRATPLVRMPKSVFFTKVRQACRTGIVPTDIRLSTLNWDHATGSRYEPGEVLSAADQRELQNCYNLLTGMGKNSVRVERPA